MDPEVNVDVSQLSETERQVIWNVLKRDEDLRKRDEQRIKRLKAELQWLRRRGAIRGGSDPMTSCARCRSELGKIINRGAPCAVCRVKICKSCRIYTKDGTQWICVVCHKQLEIEAATGEWMNEFVRRASRKRDKKGFVPPSDFIKELIARSQAESAQHEREEKKGPTGGGPALHAMSRSPSVSPSMEHRAPSSREPSGIPKSDAAVLETVPRIPVPAPRQKSPLLKQRAVNDQESGAAAAPAAGATIIATNNNNNNNTIIVHATTECVQQTKQGVVSASQGAIVRRPSPHFPLTACPSDRSDSGIGPDIQPSPRTSTSRSGSLPSRQSSINSSDRNDDRGASCSFDAVNLTESQTSTTTDSFSDPSDSEVEPASGVVFRKVTLRRRKRKEDPKIKPSDGDTSGQKNVEWEDPNNCLSQWGSGLGPLSCSLPRFSNSRSPPIPHHFTWDGSCEPSLTHSYSTDSIWWDTTKAFVLETLDGGRGFGANSSDVGINSGGGGGGGIGNGKGLSCRLSRSLGALHLLDAYRTDSTSGGRQKEYSSSWTAETHLEGQILHLPSTWKDRRRVPDELGLWNDLDVSSPEFEEDFSLDCPGTAVGVVGVTRADSFSDLLSGVTDKIIPEGEEYRIVFISSSSSKSSGLNSGDDSTCSSRRVSMLMDFSEWDSPASVVCSSSSGNCSSPLPPPLPCVPPPTVEPKAENERRDRCSPTFSIEEEELFNYFRDTDAEWKETTVVVPDDEDNDDNDYDGGSAIEKEDPPTRHPAFYDAHAMYTFIRTSSVRSSGERSISEQSFCNQVFSLQSPTSPSPPCQSGGEEYVLPTFSSFLQPPGELENPEATQCTAMNHDVQPDTALASEDEESDVDASSVASTSSSLPSSDLSGGYIEETMDSSDDECLVGSYEVNAMISDHESDEPIENAGEVNTMPEMTVQDTHEDSSEVSEAKEIDESPQVAAANMEVVPTESLHPNTQLNDVADGLPNPEDHSEERSEETHDNGHDVYPAPCVEKPMDSEASELPEESSTPLVATSDKNDEGSLQDNDDMAVKTSESITESQTENLEKAFEDAEQISLSEVVLHESAVMEEGSPLLQKEQHVQVDEIQTLSTDSDNTDLDDHGGTSSEGEKLESDTDSQDTVIEGETYRRMRQVAIRERLLQANKEWHEGDEDASSGDRSLDDPSCQNSNVLEDNAESQAVVISNEVEETNNSIDGSDTKHHEPQYASHPSSGVGTQPVANLHQLIAQSRALSAHWQKLDSDTSEDADSDGNTPKGVTSVLEKYFVTSLEHMAPPRFYGTRQKMVISSSREGDSSCFDKDSRPEEFSEQLVKNSGEEFVDESFSDGGVTDQEETVSEHSESSDMMPESAAADDDSEYAFDDNEEDDTSSTVSSSSDEGSAVLHVLPARQCIVVTSDDDLRYRQALDMSLHTIMEESCEESENERERHAEERQQLQKPGIRLPGPSELERYFQYTFEEPSFIPGGSQTLGTVSGSGIQSNSNTLSEHGNHRSAEELPSGFGPFQFQSQSSQDDAGESSDDTFSETESSVFSEGNENGMYDLDDDDELAQSASSRLEKYFLTGFLGMPENRSGVGTKPPQGSDYQSQEKNGTRTTFLVFPVQQEAIKVHAMSSPSSKDETEEETEQEGEEMPFDKNDGCDTIKRKKKDLSVEDLDDYIGAIRDLHKDFKLEESDQTTESSTLREGSASETLGDATASVEEKLVAKTVASVEELNKGPSSMTKDDSASIKNNISDASDATTTDLHTSKKGELLKTPNKDAYESSALETETKDSGGNGELDHNEGDADCAAPPPLSSWDPSCYGYSHDAAPSSSPPPCLSSGSTLGRSLTLDWKQQSRDSGFIGSSDDLLQDGGSNGERDLEDIEDKTEDVTLDPDSVSKKDHTIPVPSSASVETTVPINTVETEDNISAALASAVSIIPPPNPFGLFRSSSTRSNVYAASTTSDDDAQYIVNQLVSQIAKSMSRSPQLSRAKPPEIEIFESELTKLMQTVPGIDATVKEIVEELSSTDYCSDSYESSDYTSSDQEGGPFPLDVTKMPQFGLQLPGISLHRNDSGRSWGSLASSTTSKSSSVGQLGDDVQLPEETMYIYQRFMDSLTKMEEHASEEKVSSSSSHSVTSSGHSTTSHGNAFPLAKGSPPTTTKIVQHIRNKLTSLMREVQADRSPRPGLSSSKFEMGGAGLPGRRTIVWNKPGSATGGDELSISSTSSANFDSEDSPTDTELSMDSDDPVAGSMGSSVAVAKSKGSRALSQAQTHVKALRKGGERGTSLDPASSGGSQGTLVPSERLRDEEDEQTDGLERWSSDMTIVDDDVRFTSVHKSEPMLSTPDGLVETEKRHSRELLCYVTNSSKTLPSVSSSSHPQQPHHSSTVANSAPKVYATSQRGSMGCLYSGAHNKRTSKSEWEVWRRGLGSADDVKRSTGSASSLVMSELGAASATHKSCDPLPSSKTTKNEASRSVAKDRKKHGLAFILRQKSGSSMSLREGPTNPESRAIKQQIQFRSSLHLQSSAKAGGKEDLHQQQLQSGQQPQQQQRSSSMHWLFGGGHRKKSLGTASASSAPSFKSCWSSADSLSRVGVDVTTATGVDLSDTESGGSSCKSSRPSSGYYPHYTLPYPSSTAVTANYSTAIPFVPSGARSIQDLSLNPCGSGAKASTLPRAATGTDLLHANVSFLHTSQRSLMITSPSSTSTNILLPPSSSSSSRFLVPKPDSGSRTASLHHPSVPSTTFRSVSSSSGYGPSSRHLSPAIPKPAERHIASIDSPKFRREVRSWSGEKDSGVSEDGFSTASPSVGTGRRVKTSSPIAAIRTLGPKVPSIAVMECPDKGATRLIGGSGSHAGSSDPESMTEEDIDRLVAMHTNRSLSSLGVCSESMSSVYSAAGGGHYGSVTVRGEVQFGLCYNYVSGALEVHIKQCRDLAPVDSKRSRSDPYVKVYLLPDKTKSGKRKTRVRKHTLNPLFNEILKFYVTISELETRTLWLTVWHSDMFGRNEFLGEVTLPMGYEAWDDTTPKWYLLQERLGPPEEVYSYKGDLVIALKFVSPDITMQKKGRHSKGSLHVLVKEARNLMAVCSNGTSDPFCKSYLLPDKGKSNKQKTHVVKRTCNPKWNHTFVYEDVSVEQLRERCLELTIWDYDRLTSNDFLGGVRLCLTSGKYMGRKVDWMDARGEEVALWQTMIDRPNVWVDGTILLRPTMDHRQAAF